MQDQAQLIQEFCKVLADKNLNLEFQLFQMIKEVERLKQYEPKQTVQDSGTDKAQGSDKS